MALDANNQNVLAGASVQTAVAISAPAPTPTTPTTPAEEPTEEEAVLEEEAPVAQEPTTAPQPITEQSLLAAVGSFVTLGTNSVIVGLLVAVIVLGLAGYAIYAIIQRVRRKNFGKLR